MPCRGSKHGKSGPSHCAVASLYCKAGSVHGKSGPARCAVASLYCKVGYLVEGVFAAADEGDESLPLVKRVVHLAQKGERHREALRCLPNVCGNDGGVEGRGSVGRSVHTWPRRKKGKSKLSEAFQKVCNKGGGVEGTGWSR